MTQPRDSVSSRFTQRRLDILEARRLQQLGLSFNYIAWEFGISIKKAKAWCFRPWRSSR